MRTLRLLLALALLAALAGCAAEPTDAELGRGGLAPQVVVESFLESLNGALGDPSLVNGETRRGWAERLASYFAPSERADQRAALGRMLAIFADTSARPAVGRRVSLEVVYTRTEVIATEGDRATVRVVDGQVVLRFLDEGGELLRERTRGLAEVIGLPDGGLPVLRVGDSWYLTEG